MGQSNSLASAIPQKVDLLHDEFVRQAYSLSEIASLSYDDFHQCLRELNKLCRSCVDEDGKVIMFAVEKGSDTSVFWRAKVRIACVKGDPTTNKIDSIRLLTLNQFLKMQLTAARQTHNQSQAATWANSRQCSASSSSSTLSDHEATDTLTTTAAAHLLRQGIEDATNNLGEDLLVECCICLDRKPDVMLPCAHSFCMPCLEQWNVNHKTCPICREAVESSDETWVISDIPNDVEITQDICSSLMNLTKKRPGDSRQSSNSRQSSDER